MTKETKTLVKECSDMYRFLGGLYIMEVDKKQLIALKELSFPELEPESDADIDMAEGYKMVQNYVNKMTEDDIDDLAADYAKTFLAAGDATGKAAFPYESVYIDKKRHVGGSTDLQMKALYLKRGFRSDPDVYRMPNDHIGLMLEYMAILCDEICEALEKGDEESAREIQKEQLQFINLHIMNWSQQFLSDVEKYADYDFYRGVAKITRGFLTKGVNGYGI